MSAFSSREDRSIHRQAPKRSGVVAFLDERLDEWIREQDPTAFREGFTVAAWVAVGAFLLGTILVAGYLPGAADFFQLTVGPPLVVLGLCCASELSVARHLQRKPPDEAITRGEWTWAICSNSLVFSVCVTLMVSASPAGAAAFSSFLLVCAGLHGHLHRANLRTPFIAAGLVLPAAVAFALAPSSAHRSILLVASGAALLAHFVIGTMARRADEARRNDEKMRAALRAQLDADHARLSSRLADVLGVNHDLRNSLAIVQLSLRAFRRYVPSDGKSRGEFLQHLDQLDRAMRRVKEILSAGHQRALPASSVLLQPALLAPVVDGVISAVAHRSPNVAFDVRHEKDDLEVLVVDGETSLHRILENLVLNACEGDSVQKAARIELVTRCEPTKCHAVIAVRDDGPGFPENQLSRPIAPFATGKPNGTGLGLFTTDRLVSASGGTLMRRNAPGGGAEVIVHLPLADRVGTSSSA